VALDPQTGDIYAMSGGANYGRSTYNRATRSKRAARVGVQARSVYALALEHGYSPVSVLAQSASNVTAPDNPEWNPTTAHGDQARRNDASRAALSRVETTRPPRTCSSRLEIPGRAPPRQHGWPEQPAGTCTSLSLGTGVVSPLDPPRPMHLCSKRRIGEGARHHERLRRARGLDVSDHPSSASPVISRDGPRFKMTVMPARCDRAWNRRVGAGTLGVRGPVAARPARTDDYNDAWFVGFSTKVVAVVWVGFGPARADWTRRVRRAVSRWPIWAEFMKRTARILPPGRSSACRAASARARTLCSVSYLRPVQVYAPFTPSTSRRTTTKCRPAHCTVIAQRSSSKVKRTVEGSLPGPRGSKIAGIFRR
jgi:membrane peptidoglycan carboxypeptidase